jgi:DNA primase
MAFPPRFLDELRTRISLAEVVGRRVRLTRRGREFIGLCPFHKEKTPSFSVVEEKGFFHCFGCGQHGDVIGFVMQTESATFPEAVEALARQAGLQVPTPGPGEREKVERQATLQVATEAACAFFEEQLQASAGRDARLYLEGRGLDLATMRRFRLGLAPDRRDGLLRALGKRFPEALLIEGGLARRSEDGAIFDYFRRRIMFPIGDRQGRIIAFGGRVLGEGQPKYLNSPDTPLFQKGRVLYGWAPARAAAARTPSAIVTEGYMDVIALHRAGFTTAVAPLGTALTETQIEELWRLAPEPVLCFDGDAAGLRAQGRALERALPLLKPGHSLRFATLPEGEDPDTLILHQGVTAMGDILARARPLAEVLWEIETAHPSATPEQRAALEQRLEERARVIADRSVQEHYRSYFRTRLFEALRRNNAGRGSWRLGRKLGPNVGVPLKTPPALEAAPRSEPGPLRRRRQEILLALLLNHPFLLGDVAEELAEIPPGPPDLDKLRHEILRLHALNPDLDAATLRLHLSESGYDRVVEGVLSSQVLAHAGFARAGADVETVRLGWADTRDQLREPHLRNQIAEAERALAEETTEEKWVRLHPLLEQKIEDDGATGGGSR